MIDLLAFAADAETAALFDSSCAAGIVVDLESRGKRERQAGFDTDISSVGLEAVAAVRAATSLRIVTRINSVGPTTAAEVDAVLAGGTDEVLVPMVRSVEDVERVIHLVDSRCGVGAMVETHEAVAVSGHIARLPLTRMYLGLNDLQIDRASAHLFAAVADGTVEHVRDAVGGVPFGFGGLTLPGCGRPLETKHLINEMARLDCSFTFLRRSFFRDARGAPPAPLLADITAAFASARHRDPGAVERDRSALHEELTRLLRAERRLHERALP